MERRVIIMRTTSNKETSSVKKLIARSEYADNAKEIEDYISRCSLFALAELVKDGVKDLGFYYGGGAFNSSTKEIFLTLDSIRPNNILTFSIDDVNLITLAEDGIDMYVMDKYWISGSFNEQYECPDDSFRTLRFPKELLCTSASNPDITYIKTECIKNCSYMRKMQISAAVNRYFPIPDTNTPVTIGFTREGEKLKIGLLDRASEKFITSLKSFLWQGYQLC